MNKRYLMAALLLACGAAQAQEAFPSRPLTMVVPFPPGGVADVTGRPTAAALEKVLKQPVTINNRPGAGGAVGNAAVANARPDGYTVVMALSSITVIPEADKLFNRKPAYTLDQLAPIALVSADPVILVVHPSLPVRSVAELVKLAKVKDKGLNYASSGNGTPYHMAGEYFKALIKADIVHVPHKGSGEARTSVLSGQVEMMFDAVTTMTTHAKAGKVRALATTGLTRSKVTPELPTVIEAGVKGYEATIWLGVMAPAGTPRPILDRLNAEITKVTTRSDTAANWQKQGAEALVMTVPEFEKYLNQDIAKWAHVVKVSGAKPD